MPAYGYYSRSSIENSPQEERPTVPGILSAVDSQGLPYNRRVDLQIVPSGNNPFLILREGKSVQEWRVGWCLLLGILNEFDPPIDLDRTSPERAPAVPGGTL